ncbi:hypothetical protein PRK78_005633 [Emydomyces testavorans]|uniref:Metallo-beta-lactamase domain-containing protein n=1 Tax=Emydomyces testavorans TaxID=2070801 RepID=A0AAF0IK84_9EURO|nr:hypothetical protein PRK78_005633 [Emydomyces testavorans]
MATTLTSEMASQVAKANLPAFNCPPGTKLHLLNLGSIECDEGWWVLWLEWRHYVMLMFRFRLLRGGNASTLSNKNPDSKRRELIILSVLIEHPQAGLILFETGCGENIEVTLVDILTSTHKKWGAPLTDIFPRTVYNEEHKLPAAIKATGNDIKDVKAVVFGHLHLDHAGGLEHFVGTDVPIYVHEEEFKHACWAIATGADLGVYMAHYMSLDKLNWQTFNEAHVDLFQGITIHHSPGHTPGLCIMQVNLEKDGTFIFTSDQCHIAENYEMSHPHGWLARDHTAWFNSLQMIKRLQRMFSAEMVFGHDKEVADRLIRKKKYLNRSWVAFGLSNLLGFRSKFRICIASSIEMPNHCSPKIFSDVNNCPWASDETN